MQDAGMKHALALSALLAAAPATAQPLATPLDLWAAAWRANDMAALIALYAPDARIVSAFVPDAAEGSDAVAELLAAETRSAIGRGMRLSGVSLRQFGPVHLATGDALAVLTLPDGSVWRCPLRFSLAFIHDATGWRIIEQHTSFAPFQDE
jgi:ketosteroid isomerase-like protein